MVTEYYVVDGHHRVAMAKKLGQDFLDAHVVEYRLNQTGPPPPEAPGVPAAPAPPEALPDGSGRGASPPAGDGQKEEGGGDQVQR